MSVSVTMPRLGESVTEGTVTRWLKKEGERVEADEPLLEVSTDKVDTEIPAPASGTLSAIRVGEDETVEVGVELAVIDEAGSGAAAEAPAQGQPAQDEAPAAPEAPQQAEPEPEPVEEPQQPAAQEPEQPAAQQAAPQQAPPQQAPPQQAPPQQAPPQQAPPQQTSQQQAPPQQAPPQPAPVAQQAAPPASAQQPAAQQAAPQPVAHQQTDQQGPDGDAGGAYVTPLVRKLAAEHDVDLAGIRGTGVGGRIRKQDVLEAARSRQPAPSQAEPEPATSNGQTAQAPAPAAAEAKPRVEPSPLRGRTEKMSRLRGIIAKRMLESLQTSAQLTTVVEVDVTRIARLRQQGKADFERREGVKLSFLPFFAIATVEALKQHPSVNASIDTEAGTITYHDAEHLGIAVDTERGLAVPVIHDAGDLNLGGMARKIADLAERTRGNKVSPDELGGGTFTLTNTGSRGALFDTPIINQPQVGILGTGAVVKRPVVVDDPNVGDVIAVRSMVYLALTYDHRLVDGADAARFLVTVKERLEVGAFESELGLG
ncbi:MAG TPA: 2-oxoglutarate dehydrogenase, E2 component, dihydrolipoamide succinyltransferase [Mycobacteriales bacterium]|nr:2-oxoglutarate dehydrogenase, E2 component, dihydrolipoamide succinyltransferase [Mycobacteriales bacterium]